MNKTITLTALFTLTLVLCSFSQEYQFPELKGYRRLTNYPVYTTGDLRIFLAGAEETYLSYGFAELRLAQYQKGRNIIRLEIYRHNDNTQTFGIYASERSPSFRFLSIGTQGYKNGGSLNFFKGNHYVKIRTSSGSEKVIQILETLALRVADMLPGDAVMPKILSDFPDSGKKNNGETYIMERVLGHDFLSGAFKAVYESAKINFSVFIIDMRSSEEAGEVVNTYLKNSGMESDGSSGGKYLIRDGSNGDIFLAWKDSRIVIIQGLARDQTDIADRYTSEILQ